jgi:hypothetical protein
MRTSEEAARENELDRLLDELRHGRASEERVRELMEHLARRRNRRRGRAPASEPPW